MDSYGSRNSLLGRSQLTSSLDALEAIQLRSGMVPWFHGGRADAWNHCEAAIALAVGGRIESSRRAADWLIQSQNRDGSWCHFYQSAGVAEPRRDTNTCCYPILLAAVLDLCLGASIESKRYIEMALDGIDYVISHQRLDGSIPWAIDPGGTPDQTSLVAGSCSVYDSLNLASGLSRSYGIGDWRRYSDSAALLKGSLELGGEIYQDTSDWAMDSYYPVLAGISDSGSLTGQFLDQFYQPNWGIRCLKTGDWFTAAETAEAAIALHISGEVDMSNELFFSLERFRCEDGGYLTGLVAPTGTSFPFLEQSAYSIAAVVLAGYVVANKAQPSFASTIISLFA